MIILNLSEQQKKAVQHRDGALLVIAGAGSGKTRVLTERVRFLLQNKIGHYRVLALTFTNKAADEMRDRLQDIEELENKAFIGTLHSFCMEVINNRGNVIGLNGESHIFESDTDRKEILREVFESKPELRAILHNNINVKKDKQYLHKVLDFISEQKRNLHTPEWFEGKQDISDEEIILAYIYRQYNDLLRIQNALDYDDLLLLTYRIFTERPKIAEFYNRLYMYICIDEAQDLNFAQYHVIKALCGSNFNNLMMVGDPHQAIYGFNGASSEYMCKYFIKDFNPIKISINENYRSSKEIINTAKNLKPQMNIEGTIAVTGEVKAYSFPNEEIEADWVLSSLHELRKTGHRDIEGNISWERCAVLGRNRYVYQKLEKILNEEGIPYFTRVSEQAESESDFMRCFELGMRLLINSADRIHLQQLLDLLNTVSAFDELISMSHQNGIDILRYIKNYIKSEHLESYFVLISAWDKLELNNPKFTSSLKLLDDYANSKWKNDDEDSFILISADITMWRAHWQRYIRQTVGGLHNLTQFRNSVSLGVTQQTQRKGLALLTVHTAKGMEFDVVYIMGMCDGIFPDYRALRKAGATLDEEKHNAFVAITRSKRLAYLTYPRMKLMPWGDLKWQQPSRYLKEMGLTVNDIKLH